MYLNGHFELVLNKIKMNKLSHLNIRLLFLGRLRAYVVPRAYVGQNDNE